MRLSKKAKKEIKKRKKWYEKSVVSRHIGRVGKDDYRYILYYNLWGGDPKGAMAIGANGDLPHPMDMKEVFKCFYIPSQVIVKKGENEKVD